MQGIWEDHDSEKCDEEQSESAQGRHLFALFICGADSAV